MLSKAEKSYITSALSSNQRADGRSLTDYRSISLETGFAPLANGSARVDLGGTLVLGATKLEVESIGLGEEGKEGGRIVVSVSCSPAAYPHLTQTLLEDHQHTLTTTLSTTLSHPSLHPSNLSILPTKKSWCLSLDLVVLSDNGNIYDTLFMASRAALWDTKVPRTKSVEYKAPTKPLGQGIGIGGGSGDVDGKGKEMEMDVDPTASNTATSGFDTRHIQPTATDFELPDYWDEGLPLEGREKWPICVTLNLVIPAGQGGKEVTHFLDAEIQEELASSIQLLLFYSFPKKTIKEELVLQGMRTMGNVELGLDQIRSLIEISKQYASALSSALNQKLEEEDVRRTLKARERFAKRS